MLAQSVTFAPPSMSRERQHGRHATPSLDVSIVPHRKLRVLNLGAGGLAVETTRPFRIGRRCLITLDEQSSPASVVVRWCHAIRVVPLSRGESAILYHVGLAFLDPQ